MRKARIPGHDLQIISMPVLCVFLSSQIARGQKQKSMRISNAVFFLMISAMPLQYGFAQAPSQAAPIGSATSASTPPPPLAGASASLKPAFDTVQQTLSTINVQKWKRGDVRDEAADHIGVIQRDLKDTVPPLLTAADAAPNSVSAQLPLSRNIDAVYDVLLSVVEAARVVGQPDQVTELDQALRGLNAARVAFDGHLQQAADAAEKQVVELQATVKTQAAVKCAVLPPPVVPACTPPPAAKKAVHRKPKPPATATPTAPGTTPAPAATTKPSS
jgi:hypothetical protein